jgi:hypothetical protein
MATPCFWKNVRAAISAPPYRLNGPKAGKPPWKLFADARLSL